MIFKGCKSEKNSIYIYGRNHLGWEDLLDKILKLFHSKIDMGESGSWPVSEIPNASICLKIVT